jgi:hypothetical protein
MQLCVKRWHVLIVAGLSFSLVNESSVSRCCGVSRHLMSVGPAIVCPATSLRRGSYERPNMARSLTPTVQQNDTRLKIGFLRYNGLRVRAESAPSNRARRPPASGLTSTMVPVQGAQLELVSTGKHTDYPPILFLHGAAHGAWCWSEFFLPWFDEQGLECHAISFRGHVSSPVLNLVYEPSHTVCIVFTLFPGPYSGTW